MQMETSGETVKAARAVMLRYSLLPCAHSAYQSTITQPTPGLLIHTRNRKNPHGKLRDEARQIRGSPCRGAQADPGGSRLLRSSSPRPQHTQRGSGRTKLGSLGRSGRGGSPEPHLRPAQPGGGGRGLPGRAEPGAAAAAWRA